MVQKNYTGLIPEHHNGKMIESEESIDFKDEAEAKDFYYTVKIRVITDNNWHHLAGIISAKFQATDEKGNEVDRMVAQGDYLKIDIPGPGSKAGDGYDWAQVEELKEISIQDVNSIGFRVRPTANPLHSENIVAHFYSNQSTSTFIVTREKNKVTASIYDSNTKPNTEAKNLTDEIRHVAVGLGALSSFSKIQWQNLVEGMIKR